MVDLAGKRALVVGASSGAGRATVEQLVAAKADVVGVARGAAALDTLRVELGAELRDRLRTVVPRQLVEGTAIGETAAATYGKTMGKTAAEYMSRWERPLRSDGVAAAIVGALRGEVPAGVTAIAVSAGGVEPLP